MKSDIKKQIEQLVIVIISGVLAYFFPLATKFINIKSDTILAGFDIAIFNTLLNVLWLGVQYQLQKKMMKIEMSIKSIEQESSELHLTNESVGETIDIVASIIVKGKKRSCKKKLLLKCPDSYILQINKKYPYITEKKTSEIYEIDLNKMLEKSPEIDLDVTRQVYFSLSLEDYNKGDIDSLKFEKEKNWGWLNIESKKIKLAQK